MSRHPLLLRQLRRRLGEAEPDDAGLARLLDDVSAAYEDADRSRDLLERSLELTSQELFARNQALHEAMSGGDIAIWSLDHEDHLELHGPPLPFVRLVHGSARVTLAQFLAAVVPADRDRAARALAPGPADGRVELRCLVADDRGLRCLELRGRHTRRGPTRATGVCMDVSASHAEEHRRRAAEQHQQALGHLTEWLAVSHDAEPLGTLEDRLEVVSRTMAAALDGTTVAIWLNDPAAGALTLASASDSSGCLELPHLLAADGRRARALRTGRIHVTAAPGAGGGAATTLEAPVMVRDELLAVVALCARDPARTWTVDERAFTSSVASLLAVMLEGRRRLAAEAALAQKEQLLRAVIDTAPNLIFAKDREGRFTLVNRATAEAYGCAVDELVGRTDAEFNPDAAEVARFRADDLAVIETRQERRIAEEPLTDAGGSTRWLQTVKRPLIAADGGCEQVLGVSTDITERRRSEETRRQLEQWLQQAQRLESLGLLAGGVAHDFNNLLTPMLAYVDLLQESLAGEPHLADCASWLDDVRTSALRARDLTGQLLAFGRKQPLAMAAVDLNKEIGRLRSMLDRVIPSNIEIVTDLDPRLPSVRGDRAQLHQILMNLAANARDAMPGGGRLTFRTRHELVDREVVLEVADTGHGMDAATRAQIFEPFFTTKTLGRGTGLGLATVYGIVQQHGGTIDVRSTVGEGTTFEVRLPATGDRARDTLPPTRPRPLTARVLVVEDDPRVLRLTWTILNHHKVDVHTASGPEEAINLVRELAGELDLLLTAVMMPVMNGRELHARLVAEHGPIPVLYMTGYARDVLDADGVLGEELAILTKPFTAAALMDHVARALGQPAEPPVPP